LIKNIEDKDSFIDINDVVDLEAERGSEFLEAAIVVEVIIGTKRERTRLQTDPAGRVVGLRVPAPWVGPATLMGSHGSGLKYLWGPDPWMGTRWVIGPSLGPGSWVLGIDYVIL
jgi:hypothetical protein